MISFKILTEENKDSILSDFALSLSESERCEISDYISSFDLSEEDVEIGVSFFSGCVLVRIFDMGRYFFLFPAAITEDADILEAIFSIAEYAMREEISPVFCGVGPNELQLFSGFRHMDIDADDAECATYSVRIKTECELLEEIPRIVGERVKLRELLREDIPLYARLCKDENVNKYWGYDYKEDVPNPDDDYFFENAASEFSRGVAFSMAVTLRERFVGEATLYAFDGMGGAEFSIRLLPEYHGQGVGGEAVSLIFEAARRIGLVRIAARVSDKNRASIAMLSHYAQPEPRGDGTVEFAFTL